MLHLYRKQRCCRETQLVVSEMFRKKIIPVQSYNCNRAPSCRCNKRQSFITVLVSSFETWNGISVRNGISGQPSAAVTLRFGCCIVFVRHFCDYRRSLHTVRFGSLQPAAQNQICSGSSTAGGFSRFQELIRSTRRDQTRISFNSFGFIIRCWLFLATNVAVEELPKELRSGKNQHY